LHRENDEEQEQNPAEDQFEFGGHGFLVFTFKLGGHAPYSERRKLSNVRFAEVRIQGLDHIQRECLRTRRCAGRVPLESNCLMIPVVVVSPRYTLRPVRIWVRPRRARCAISARGIPD
jgi:hypothetical protein